MSKYLRILSIPLALAALLLAGCGPATIGVGVSDGYYYGAHRLPRDYFYEPDYYDGLWYQDYVMYDGSWYYQGDGTPYAYDSYTW